MATIDEGKLIAEYFAETASDRASGERIIIDVGAHFGSSFKPYLQNGWRVIAFEPDASKHEKLAQYESHPKFELIKSAVSDAPGKLTFFVSEESTGIASLLNFRDTHRAAGEVPVVTLRDVLSERKITRIDYLKIDVEGYDLNVLRGHDWTVLPEVLLVEFDELKTRRLGHTYRDLANFIVARGYDVFVSEWFPIIRYGVTHQWRCIVPYPCEIQHPDAWGNLIAIRKDAHPAGMREIIARLSLNK